MTPKDRILSRQVTLLKAMGHPSRLWILQTLRKGERCVGDLQAGLEQDISTVSRHLLVLRNAGLVRIEKRGLYVYYQLRCSSLDPFFHALSELHAEPRKGL